MLKTLKNQSKRKILLNNKIKSFIKEQLWQHIFMVAFVLLCGILFNKIIISVLFYPAHYIIRSKFEKQYHCKHSKRGVAISMCLCLSCTVSFFAIIATLPLRISLLSVIPVCYFIGWVGYIVQDRIDCRVRLKQLETKSVYEMDRNELLDYCFIKGIRNEMAEFVLMVLIDQMHFREIAEKLFVSVDTLKHCWSPKCKEKLGITEWR